MQYAKQVKNLNVRAKHIFETHRETIDQIKKDQMENLNS